MQGIFDLLKIPNLEIVSSTLEALIKIAEINYQHMHPYLDRIKQVTEVMITNASNNS
jgi:hypothetical protein